MVIGERLGGAPGRFAVVSAVLGIAWFPLRLYLDRGDSLAAIVAASGLYGVGWSLMVPMIDRLNRNAPGRTRGAPHPRRGAVVGLAVGVPFHGSLLALCLATGRSWVYTASYAVIVSAIVVIAVGRLWGTRHSRAIR